MKYRKKPVVVEAVQFVDTEESILKLSELELDPVRIDYADLDNPILKIETLEGLMIATEGDYIIKGVQGEFYPCKPDIFCRNIRRIRVSEYFRYYLGGDPTILTCRNRLLLYIVA